MVKIVRDTDKPMAKYYNVVKMVCTWIDDTKIDDYTGELYRHTLYIEKEYLRTDGEPKGALSWEDISPIDEIEDVTAQILVQVPTGNQFKPEECNNNNGSETLEL